MLFLKLSSLLQVIPLAWSVMDGGTHETYCASFHILRESLVTWKFGSATCGDGLVSSAFFSIFNLPVYPSLYDYVNVSCFSLGGMSDSPSEAEEYA